MCILVFASWLHDFFLLAFCFEKNIEFETSWRYQDVSVDLVGCLNVLIQTRKQELKNLLNLHFMIFHESFGNTASMMQVVLINVALSNLQFFWSITVIVDHNYAR